ncbi:MAG: GNAT family N-acetyltransferase [Prevotella sp.]|nr:GNAT family N-acetyltransferase [Prevotella sp.]
MRILAANKAQTNQIARLIMQAMHYDCCRYFMGQGHTLDEFEWTMTMLVGTEISQYSYLNTIVALDDRDEISGICVSYDGGMLHELRKAFVVAMKEGYGRDFNNMDDETCAGELYVDSLAVREDSRGKGIATALLSAVIDKGRLLRMPAVGLLVDQGNPKAERLYKRVGFEYVEDAVWGGHPMRHLQYRIKQTIK